MFLFLISPDRGDSLHLAAWNFVTNYYRL